VLREAFVIRAHALVEIRVDTTKRHLTHVQNNSSVQNSVKTSSSEPRKLCWLKTHLESCAGSTRTSGRRNSEARGANLHGHCRLQATRDLLGHCLRDPLGATAKSLGKFSRPLAGRRRGAPIKPSQPSGLDPFNREGKTLLSYIGYPENPPFALPPAYPRSLHKPFP
jgi:hypothetical protein